ncbi:MAG TPA: DUF952 domain-containing protein [Leptospiraceae bacterium]|nr:DUF952 domain-containing protein [Leptospiraceae bacterium]HMY67769.1 DUF952 domain-containing protein [Leptospiraceae bacterium]HNF15810.1 DUF952 domain-containing protein [Leptospiraceae bacterium]HNF28625.1 DUF952 domain-containing protein [Leptospiraceae bacterium]HNI96223.1 DUF952 domain-containing protein [Leptospiraceae bacterium]
MIYHITDRDSWNKALSSGLYSPESLYSDGYIHCSFFSQVKYTKENYFRGVYGLIVLCIDENRLKSEYRTEKGSGRSESDLFPHIYGTLNTDAVCDTLELDIWTG